MVDQEHASTEGPALGELVFHYEQLLLGRYGPLIRGADLVRVAGYPNSEALRLAVRRQVVGFPVFKIAGRRGRFAHAGDVARWLAQVDAHSQVKGGSMS
ncbi:hypothetical protein [Lysobacter sp. K5869]|uniref:hypothetical protein n=1 Tax=Lysobacter sp. K5869 TaxID=2820808 RepID=UPI002101446A|nr:hypothetical protein [Lysobacter sp. K5869]